MYGICREYVWTILEGTLGDLFGGGSGPLPPTSQEMNASKWNMEMHRMYIGLCSKIHQGLTWIRTPASEIH